MTPLVCALSVREKNITTLHSVALLFSAFGGVSQKNLAAAPSKGPVAPTFSALKGGVALQVASWSLEGVAAQGTVACRAAVGHLELLKSG